MPGKRKTQEKPLEVVKTAGLLRQLTGSEDFQEKRRTARLNVPIEVQYRIVGKEKNPKGSVTKDVSVGGCLLLVKEELSLNSEVDLQIFLGETESEMLKLKGTVVRLNRAQENLYESGIAFNNLTREANELFADFFFSKMYEMIGLREWPTDKRVQKKDK